MKTKNQFEALKKKRNRELKNVRALDPGFSCEGAVGRFISLYIQSELFAKKLQHYYRTEKKKSGNDELDIRSLRSAVAHFRLPFEGADLDVLFKGGRGKRGSKSARQLRNGYLHSLSQQDREEILNNARVHSSKLSVFLALQL